MLEITKAEALDRLIDLPEHQLVRLLLDHAECLYDYFNFVTEPAIGPPRSRKGWEYIFLAEVPLTAFGFQPGLQPGDVDVLIIPTRDGKAYPEYMGAIEVKRLALRGPNWTKNTDRYGIKQAYGLLRCGFPFIGILHLIVSAPVRRNFIQSSMLCK